MLLLALRAGSLISFAPAKLIGYTPTLMPLTASVHCDIAALAAIVSAFRIALSMQWLKPTKSQLLIGNVIFKIGSFKTE